MDSFFDFVAQPQFQILFVILCTFIWFYGRNEGSLNNNNNNRLPGPTGIPFIGVLPHALGKRPYDYFDKLAKRYGEVYSIKIAGRKYIVMNSYDVIKEAFITNGDNFINRPSDFTLFGLLIDFKSMGIKSGPEWRHHRKILASSMKGNVEDLLLVNSERMTEEIRTLDSSPSDLYNILAQGAFNVVSSLVTGEELTLTQPHVARSILDDSGAGFGMLTGGDGFLSGIFQKSISILRGQYQRLIRIQKKQFNLTTQFLDQHKLSFDPDNLRDYIDMNLNEKLKFEEAGDVKAKWFTDEIIKANVSMFYLGGLETTSFALYFGLFLMAKYPKVQMKCQDEIDHVISLEDTIRLKDKNRLPYMEAVINEILRYSNIGPLPQPRISLKATTLLGFDIPPHTDIITNLWTATRDPKYWPNPNEFDPNNFYGKDVPRDLGSLVFSAGKRMCPGQKLARQTLFVFLTSLVRNFTFSVAPGDSFKEQVLPGFTRLLAPFRVLTTPRSR